MAVRAVSGLAASPGRAFPDGPKIFCACATLSGLLPRTTIRAPASIKALAAEKPSPVVPPITTITLLASLGAIGYSNVVFIVLVRGAVTTESACPLSHGHLSNHKC